jgi:hypothetical protein
VIPPIHWWIDPPAERRIPDPRLRRSAEGRWLIRRARQSHDKTMR